MKLYEYYGKTGFHTCIVSTFGVDFDAYENAIFSRARGAGCHNNLLIADGRMLSLALDGSSALPQHAGRLYSVTGAVSTGVFHPKITLQLGRSTGRLIVSSANVTASGLAGNLEMGGVIECQAEESGERNLLAAAFRYLTRFLDQNDPGIRQQLDWARARTPWILENAGDGPVVLKDGSRASFLSTGKSQGIARQFLDSIGRDKVDRLIFISPYWDDRLAALHFLMDETKASEAIVLLDEERHVFPATALNASRRVKIVSFRGSDERRFIHAKLIIAQTADMDHVLYGSANATAPALGNDGYAGDNEEASLYRALPRNAAIEALGLAAALQAPPLDPGALPTIPTEEPIPLDDLAQKFPGRFSCLFDTLTWHLPPNASGNDTLEFLGPAGKILSLELQPLPLEHNGERRFRIANSGERPFFARVRYADGGVSAPAVILVQDLLRSAVRDARSKRIDVAIAALDGDTDIGLWLLETVSELEAAETSLREGVPIKRQKAVQPSGTVDDNKTFAKLSYEEFINGRRLRSDTASLSHDTLGATSLSYIHGFLNRVLALGGGQNESFAEFDGEKLAAAFNMGDEVDDAEKALEAGGSFSQPPIKPTPDPQEAELLLLAQQRFARQRRANREQLIGAVSDFQGLVARKAVGSLTSIDLLRFRAMLMIILAAAWDGISKPSSSLQVLLPSGDMDAAWPRLLGKCLFAYFGGSSPAVRKLIIEDYYDQLPDDMLECWSTCFWTYQAVLDVSLRTPEYKFLVPSFQRLGTTVYALTGLRSEEFLDERIMRPFDAFSQRFGKALSLDPVKLLIGHKLAAAGKQGVV